MENQSEPFAYQFEQDAHGVRMFVMESGALGMERGGETFILAPVLWFERVSAWTAEHMAATPTVSPPTAPVGETQLMKDEALNAVFRLFHAFTITAEEADSITRPIISLGAENAQLTQDLTAAWANGKKVKEDNDKLRTLLQDAMDVSWTGDDDAIEVKKRIYAALRGE